MVIHILMKIIVFITRFSYCYFRSFSWFSFIDVLFYWLTRPRFLAYLPSSGGGGISYIHLRIQFQFYSRHFLLLRYMALWVFYFIINLFTFFVTFVNYFRPHLRDWSPSWLISDFIYGIRISDLTYGIRYLVELFHTSFAGFVTSLNYFRPHLRNSLPRWNIPILICGIRYLVKLFQTSFTEFVTSLYYFRPRVWDLLSHWTILDRIYGIR